MKIKYDLINKRKIIRKKQINFVIVLDTGDRVHYTLPDNVADDIYDKIGEYAIFNDVGGARIEEVKLESINETEPIE